MVAAITKPLPDLTEAGSALLGAGAAMQLPNVFKTSGWTNVLWSAGITILGALGLGMAKMDKKVVSGFAIGGTVITAAKAIHVATKGGFGLSPQQRFVQSRPTSQSEAPVTGNIPALGPGEDTGIVRPAVGGFRQSEYEGVEEPLLG